MNTRLQSRRAGFTLVELLVVIAIIGVLAAILIPTVYAAMVKARNTKIAMEISAIAKAVEAYKSKHGDYPPDFTDQAVVQRHFNKIFPRRDQSLDPNFNSIDPAEALVFCLGGYSDNVQNPFRGAGGPLSGNYYNRDRNLGIMDFDVGRLSLTTDSSGNYISNDEGQLHGDSSQNDAFPVYVPKGQALPYVYFDSRTYYNTATSTYAVYPPPSLQGTTGVQGRAYPYIQTPPTASAAARFVNEKTYQIISAGLDDNYGTYSMSTSTSKQFPTGVNYASDRTDHDNITNFSNGILEDSLP